jgi:hypothetical protein
LAVRLHLYQSRHVLGAALVSRLAVVAGLAAAPLLPALGFYAEVCGEKCVGSKSAGVVEEREGRRVLRAKEEVGAIGLVAPGGDVFRSTKAHLYIYQWQIGVRIMTGVYPLTLPCPNRLQTTLQHSSDSSCQ